MVNKIGSGYLRMYQDRILPEVRIPQDTADSEYPSDSQSAAAGDCHCGSLWWRTHARTHTRTHARTHARTHTLSRLVTVAAAVWPRYPTPGSRTHTRVCVCVCARARLRVHTHTHTHAHAHYTLHTTHYTLHTTHYTHTTPETDRPLASQRGLGLRYPILSGPHIGRLQVLSATPRRRAIRDSDGYIGAPHVARMRAGSDGSHGAGRRSAGPSSPTRIHGPAQRRGRLRAHKLPPRRSLCVPPAHTRAAARRTDPSPWGTQTGGRAVDRG